ncbi:MAG: AraC family transcriptional regulator [Micropruina sp.]
MTEFQRSGHVHGLEARRSCQENPCYRPHSHDSFSVGLIDAGSSVLSGPVGGSIRLEPGDVVVIPSGQVHACNPDDGRWVYQMIHADQPWAASLTPHGDHTPLFLGIQVLRREGLASVVEAFGDAVFADEARENIETAAAVLLQELESVSPTHLVTSEANRELIARLSPVMERLTNDESNPSLDELARLVEMSKYQLVRAMRRATGLSPMAWRQNARIIQARRLLREGRAIADTAYTLGFTDQSHFHRVFRSHVAVSPGGYRG